jgi:gamma-glutamyltranspeptidase/glutathione hydrolase
MFTRTKPLVPALVLTVSSLLFSPWAGADSALQTAPVAIKYDLTYHIVSPVQGQHGMVATEHALATQIGLDILKKGGNAIDAGVAVGFALAVVLPNAGNIGGGGFMMIHNAATKKNVALDFREMAPARASRDMYLDASGQVVAGKSLYTHHAIGVPGSVAGLAHALSTQGTMTLAEVIAPAIQIAEAGFPVSPTLAALLEADKKNLGKWASTKAIFFKEDRPLRAGELLIQQDLANTLKRIAKEGPKAFYEGQIAQAIIAEMATHQGLITLKDLKNYQVVERQPVVGNYRGYEVLAMPPPSSGGAHIIQMLNMLAPYPLKEYGHNSAKTIHLMTEVMKLAYADRAEYLGDPDFVKVPLAGLTSPAYAAKLAEKINLNQATPSVQIKPGQPQPYESDQTTHYSIVDQAGNMVATTYTLNTNFGSGIVASGTGILLNNQMDDFSVKPGVANAYGLIGGEANAIAAMKRPLSSMAPTFVLKNQQPFMITGTPGGARIITTTLQTILNVIDHDMNIAEALVAPRIHHQWMPDELRIEKGISADTLALLQQRGHHLALKPAMGRAQSIQINNGMLYGYSDPRNPDGLTLGY